MAKRIRYYKTERLGALSDGIFAIVLTLLVLELRLPEAAGTDNQVWVALADNAHELLGWVVSFVVLARMWAIHHDTLASLRLVSSRTILINFLFLGTISLVPFAAKLVGTYEFTDPMAIVVFSAMLGLTGLTLGWVIAAAEADARLHVKEHRGFGWRARHHLLFVPLIAVAAILASLLHPALGLGVLFIEAIAAIIALVTTGDDDELDGPDLVVVSEGRD